jgi:hypothetical protein
LSAEATAPALELFEIDVKIEQSAKGARVTVHCRGHDDASTILRAVSAYKNTRNMLAVDGESVAPAEGGK